MSAPETATVTVAGHPCRVWRKGSGPLIGVLPGYGGYPKWPAFADRLAETRTVVVPSLPGYPGGAGHLALDGLLDWLIATRDLLHAAGLDGADLVGISVAAPLAADVAALWPETVGRLILVGPFGLFDEADPVVDPWGQRGNEIAGMLCADAERFTEMRKRPEDADPVEWQVETVRAMEASARYLWPLGATGIEKRLGRIRQRTLLAWGEADRIVPRSYAAAFADGIAGETETAIVPRAGHLVDLDQPDALAATINRFLN